LREGQKSGGVLAVKPARLLRIDWQCMVTKIVQVVLSSLISWTG
jgi:hypothetical protein